MCLDYFLICLQNESLEKMENKKNLYKLIGKYKHFSTVGEKVIIVSNYQPLFLHPLSINLSINFESPGQAKEFIAHSNIYFVVTLAAVYTPRVCLPACPPSSFFLHPLCLAFVAFEGTLTPGTLPHAYDPRRLFFVRKNSFEKEIKNLYG